MSELEQHIDQQLEDPRTLPYDEAGFAARLVARHGQDMHWVEKRRCWYVWHEHRWQPDDYHLVEAWAIETADSLHAEADALQQQGNSKSAEYVRNQVPRWRSSGKVRAAIYLAKGFPGVSITFDAFDHDGWILNTPSGVIDLRTGKLRPHRREDLCTKITAAAYDPDARHPALDQVLRTATQGDVELQTYIQKAFGYSLCGENPLECIFFVHGPTRSGKTTLLEAVKKSLGDYAKSADFKSFLDRGRNGGGGRQGLARLAGARLVGSSEVKRGARLAEDVLKWISGNDVIVDNEVYEKEIEFRPQFTLWLLANDQPRAAADDDAIWQRIKVIPFLHTIPKGERDPAVKSQLVAVEGTVRAGTRELPAAGPAVLAWVVRGCLLWQETGLDEPASVADATEEYRAANDPIAGFLEECTERVEKAETVIANMRQIYERWASNEGTQPVSDRQFKSFMAQHGHPQDTVKRDGKTWRIWTDIVIREDAANGYGLREVTRNPYSRDAHARDNNSPSNEVTNSNRNSQEAPQERFDGGWSSLDAEPPF